MVFFLILFLCSSLRGVTMSEVNYTIGCGIPKSRSLTSENGFKIWQSDDNSIFAPPYLNKFPSATNIDGGEGAPYTRARIFESPMSYSFPSSPGPKFLRLYFTTTASYSYNNLKIQASQLIVSVEANGLILLQNFSLLNNPKTSYEFYLTLQKDVPIINITLAPPLICPTTKCYGFVNGIEIITLPQGLYINATRNPQPVYVSQNLDGYPFQDTAALETVYRINVGGSTVDPVNDSGGLGRTWESDQSYLVGNFTGTTVYPNHTLGLEGNLSVVKYTPETPFYVAPRQVYTSLRIMNLPYLQNLEENLTWRFDVDPGFDYLVRLHFCELDDRVTGSQERVFKVYINNETAGDYVDVWDISGGFGIAVFRDYVISLSDGSNGTKIPLWLALHPRDSSDFKLALIDVLLNGIEIFKVSQVNGNLAAQNLLSPMPPSPPQNGKSNHKTHFIIIGVAIGGAVIASLCLFACLAYKRKASTNYSTKDNLGSSLPSDLCRRFSLTQIRVATRNFDDNLIIGKGGFGMVYKGSIEEEETTIVAIKRLNSTSKQGAHEFQTEIQMLSRLRHLHLVPLIGYCEDQGEMILVYDYMPRGTLQDHLMYKNPNKTTPLSWKQRLRICIGSARGLQYLHSGAKQQIIHRDVKSTNILLDEKWTAKVSDFGISKIGLVPGDIFITHVSTDVKGSVGYLDPEYYRRRQLTEKSDVYSFGVVLFEVLCARSPMNPTLPKEEVNLAIWATYHIRKGTLHTIVDPNIRGEIAPESLKKFGEIGEMCVRDNGSDRPSIGDVVWALEFALKLQETAENNNNIIHGLGDKDVVTYMDVSTDSEVKFSESSSVDSGTKGLLDNKTTRSNSSEYLVEGNYEPVFSEIMDPEGR